jgi:hypothetical protein
MESLMEVGTGPLPSPSGKIGPGLASWFDFGPISALWLGRARSPLRAADSRPSILLYRSVAAVAIFHLLSTNFPGCGISRARTIHGLWSVVLFISAFTFQISAIVQGGTGILPVSVIIRVHSRLSLQLLRLRFNVLTLQRFNTQLISPFTFQPCCP